MRLPPSTSCLVQECNDGPAIHSGLNKSDPNGSLHLLILIDPMGSFKRASVGISIMPSSCLLGPDTTSNGMVERSHRFLGIHFGTGKASVRFSTGSIPRPTGSTVAYCGLHRLREFIWKINRSDCAESLRAGANMTGAGSYRSDQNSQKQRCGYQEVFHLLQNSVIERPVGFGNYSPTGQ